MSKALYMNKEDARDIRNMDEILSDHTTSRRYIVDEDLRRDLWALFRKWRVRLDKSGDTTKPWQKVNTNDGRRTRFQKTGAASTPVVMLSKKG